jgi:uncharacterized heparinase superfamily protein
LNPPPVMTMATTPSWQPTPRWRRGSELGCTQERALVSLWMRPWGVQVTKHCWGNE